MSHNKKTFTLSLIGVLALVITGYCAYYFSTTMSVAQLENYMKTTSLRESQTFLKVEDGEAGKDFLIYVSKKQDETKTKSQEIFIFKKRKGAIPFTTRYYNFTDTVGSQMYLPVDRILITENGENLKNGMKRCMILYSANESKISKIEYVLNRNGDDISQVCTVSPDEAFEVTIPDLGIVEDENVQFIKADFYGEDHTLLYSVEK